VNTVRRTLTAVLSAGWLIPMGFSAFCLLTLLQAQGPFGIVSPVDLSNWFLGVACVWLGMVIAFWAWRFGGRAGWVLAIFSAGWLVPVWIATKPMYLTFALIDLTGPGKGLPLIGEASRLVKSGALALAMGCVWLAVVIGFWSWRLAGSKDSVQRESA
jgi:hypothetical protein